MLPSGLHNGDVSNDDIEVRRVAFPPVDDTVYISPLYVKAIFEPSGEMAVFRSHSGDATAGTKAASIRAEIAIFFNIV